MAVYRGIAEKLVEIYDFDWQSNSRMKEACICSVEGVVSNIVNVGLVVLTAFALGISREALLFIMTFAAMRLFAGGAHAKNYVRCISTYMCVLLISVSCAKYGAAMQGNGTNIICGCSVVISMIINYKYAARQQGLGERTIRYRKIAGSIFIIICAFMLVLCIAGSCVGDCSVRKGIREVVFIQSFALLAQSIALWMGRGECREGRESLSK